MGDRVICCSERPNRAYRQPAALGSSDNLKRTFTEVLVFEQRIGALVIVVQMAPVPLVIDRSYLQVFLRYL